MKTLESITISLTYDPRWTFSFQLWKDRENHMQFIKLLLNKVGVKRQELMSSILILPTPVRWPNMNHFTSLCVKWLCMVRNTAELIQWELLNLECRQAEIQQRSSESKKHKVSWLTLFNIIAQRYSVFKYKIDTSNLSCGFLSSQNLTWGAHSTGSWNFRM